MNDGTDVLLELPNTVEAHLLSPDIIQFKHVVPWGKELVQQVDALKGWQQSTQIKTDHGPYTDEARTSDSIMVSTRHHPELRPYEVGLVNAFHSCLHAFVTYNPFLRVTDDVGYELLRYKVGGEFKEHVDAVIVKGRSEGARILTGLCYLNDDYEGGETSFPRQGVKIRPGVGDIVLFPSNFCYPHSSPPVTRGTKYVCVTWFVTYPKR